MRGIPPFFTPAGMLARAVVPVALFLLLHALGLRDYASVISFTAPDGMALTMRVTALGYLYILAWFGSTLLAPVLALAAALLALTSRNG